jgi:hypothetical protein
MYWLLSKPPTDDNTIFLFRRLIEQYIDSDQAHIYYMWSCPPSSVEHFLTNTNFDKPLVIIAIKDMLDGWAEFDYWNDKQQMLVKKINDVAIKYPNTQFVFFTSLEKLDLELQSANIEIVCVGGDIVNQKNSYPLLEPVLDKNFDSNRCFISLNRNRRDHRIVTLSYLFGRGFDQHGTITFLKNSPNTVQPAEFLDRICWQFDQPRHNDIRDAMIEGYQRLQNFNPADSDQFDIYGNYINNNFRNFNQSLRSRYRSSFVEIVSESSCCAPSFNVTEKTANAFYGCNFPIFVGGQGIVQHLRDLGLDVYDDIVDHSYDTISNPFDRITQAIDCNAQLLTDVNYVKQIWKKNQHRFMDNIHKIKTIYQWYDVRVTNQWQQVAQKLCVTS